MKLSLIRTSNDTTSTLGHLDLDGVQQCVTVEDEPRQVKVHGETRIPAGTYEIKLRTVGRFHERFLAKFGPAWHKGMLWLQNVPGFEFILIHTGNTEKDTEGCIIVGTTAVKNAQGGGSVAGSVDAYKRLYPKVRDALLRGDRVTITVVDNVP